MINWLLATFTKLLGEEIGVKQYSFLIRPKNQEKSFEFFFFSKAEAIEKSILRELKTNTI